MAEGLSPACAQSEVCAPGARGTFFVYAIRAGRAQAVPEAPIWMAIGQITKHVVPVNLETLSFH